MYEAYAAAAAAARGGADATGGDVARARTLQRWARVWLLVVCVAPALSGAAVLAYRTTFPHAERFLTHLNIGLFVLASSVRPLRHLFGSARTHALEILASTQYPRAEVADLAARVVALESRLDLLEARTATHQELEDVQDVVKPLLAQVIETVHAIEARTAYVDRSTNERLFALEQSALTAARDDGTAQVHGGAGHPRGSKAGQPPRVRGVVAILAAPFLLPFQLAAATWDVLTSPFRTPRRLRAAAAADATATPDGPATPFRAPAHVHVHRAHPKDVAGSASAAYVSGAPAGTSGLGLDGLDGRGSSTRMRARTGHDPLLVDL